MPSPQFERMLASVAAAYAVPAGGTAAAPTDAELVAHARKLNSDVLVVDGVAPSISRTTKVTPVSAGGVPCEWVCAEGCDPGRRLFFIHGGGWIVGTLDDYRHQVEELSRATGMAVLAVDYRLAPEHPYPAGLDDCMTAWAWMLDNGPDGPGATGSTALAGDSAGGNLVFCLMLRLKDEGGRLPGVAAAFAPATDFTGASPSMTERAHLDPMIDPDNMAWIAGQYIQDGTPLTHPYVSPVYGDLSGLPPFLVHAGEREVLHDDGLRIVEAAKAAGVDARFKTLPGLIHTTEYWCHVVPEGLESLNEIGAFLAARA